MKLETRKKGVIQVENIKSNFFNDTKRKLEEESLVMIFSWIKSSVLTAITRKYENLSVLVGAPDLLSAVPNSSRKQS